MQQSGEDAGNGATRRLVIMRHAKAEPTAPSDHERALAARGSDDAEAAGRWLAEQGITPDVALVSDALRTRQTWARVAGGAGWDEAVAEFSEALYAAGPDPAFDLLRETDAAVGTLVVIGHNPTMAYVAELIDDGEGDGDATTGMVTRGFPTSALAVFAVDGPWSDLGPGAGRLEAFHVGGA
ncbi:SixA phosphatase family protein [Nocardioides baculatus]|jgi:phosphohistidine phosphatase|uniref:Histidine phosphatase family protein n=1 Tax=Nocardioides baculatus TaxID=2801337 RepID=A0ABS1L7Y7_9ACTN|nr:histidine phosphatase family protein [Nocardioides baculatus]MBL0747799.1 histidine phosphatase family protein [Nocardioides baculatus]